MVYIEFYFIRQVKVDRALSHHKISIKLSLYGEFDGLCVMQFVRLATTRVTIPAASHASLVHTQPSRRL